MTWRIPPDLPERGAEPLSEMVQVTLANGAVTTAQYHHGRDEWLAIGNGHRQSVLAWQPLPPAYVPPVPEPAAMTAEEKLEAIREQIEFWKADERTGDATPDRLSIVGHTIAVILDAPLASPWRPIETAPVGAPVPPLPGKETP